MLKFIVFLLTYDKYIFLAMFGALTTVALANFTLSPYAKQNKRLKRFGEKITAHPTTLAQSVRLLPEEYQRQWRAYLNSHRQKPSVIFEFVKIKPKYRLWWLHALCLPFSLFYFVASFFLVNGDYVMIAQIAFLFASLLVLLANSVLQEVYLKLAKKTFGRFVFQLNVANGLVGGKSAVAKVDDTPAQISALKDTPTTNAVDDAMRLLRKRGLDNPRTPDEQRKLNLALNNLLQAYSKRKG